MKKLLLAAAILAASSTAQAAPLLFAYSWGGAGGLANTALLEGMLNRKLDGVEDFDSWTSPMSQAGSNVYWAANAWKGHGYKLEIHISLAWADTPLTQVAAGAADAQFTSMGQQLVKQGFPDAYIRLGAEMQLANGWPWEGNPTAFKAAYIRAYKLLKAVSPSFHIMFNPSTCADPTAYYPGDQYVDILSWDTYATSWCTFKAEPEPAFWSDLLNGPWGMQSIGTASGHGWNPQVPTAVSEFGVGSRGDGHGVCTKTGASDCDDGYAEAQALAYFAKTNAVLETLWNVNAGDYNAQISDASRPGEAWAAIDAVGSAALKATLAAHATPGTYTDPLPVVTCLDAAGNPACHVIVRENGPKHFTAVIWAGVDHPGVTIRCGGKTTNSNLYAPGGDVVAAGAACTVGTDLKGGAAGTRVLAISQ